VLRCVAVCLYDVLVNIFDDEKELWCVCVLRCVAVCLHDVVVSVFDDGKELWCVCTLQCVAACCAAECVYDGFVCDDEKEEREREKESMFFFPCHTCMDIEREREKCTHIHTCM